MEQTADELRAVWPEAPVLEEDRAGRWVSFAAPNGRTVYLQRYAWDANCLPHYLVVTTRGAGAVEQERFFDLIDAIGPLTRALDDPAAPAQAA